MEGLDKRGKRSLISDFRRVIEKNGINSTEFPQISQLVGKPGLYVEGNCFEHPTKAARSIVRLMCNSRNLVNQKALGLGLGKTADPGYAMMALISDYKRWNLDQLHTWDWIKKSRQPFCIQKCNCCPGEQPILYRYGRKDIAM